MVGEPGGTGSGAAGVKYTSGSQKRKKVPHGAEGVTWHRGLDLLRKDSWDATKRALLNPDYGTVIGRLYHFGEINARQASAARLYAEVVGRYDRFHPTRDAVLRRSAKSPAYERGSRGRDDEVERLSNQGQLPEWERRAKRARKAYLKLDSCVPNDLARTALDEICIHNREINSVNYPDLVRILERIADKFRFRMPNEVD